MIGFASPHLLVTVAIAGPGETVAAVATLIVLDGQVGADMVLQVAHLVVGAPADAAPEDVARAHLILATRSFNAFNLPIHFFFDLCLRDVAIAQTYFITLPYQRSLTDESFNLVRITIAGLGVHFLFLLA